MVLPTRRTQEPRRPLPQLRGWTRKFSSFLRFQQYRPDQVSVSTVIVALDGTGDFDNIQAAIDSLPDTGGKVLIKEGTYTPKGPIIISKDNVELSGYGKSSRINGLFVPTFGSIVILVQGIISGTIIKNLYIFGTGTGFADIGIFVHSGTDLLIDNCWIENCGNRGLSVRDAATNCKITNNFISNNEREAIHFSSSGTGNLISGNTIFDNGRHGIRIINSNNNEIVNNTVFDNDVENSASFDGIHLDNSSFNAISNNRCYDNDRYEINIADSNCQGNNVTFNNLQGDDRVAAINDDGTDTQIGHNVT